MNRQVKVWVHPNEMKNINELGYPQSYSLQPSNGLVEMTITSDEFQQWQMKKSNPIQERSFTGKQLLSD
jgi:hypothetical protein